MLLENRITPLQDRERLIDVVNRAMNGWQGYTPSLDYFRRDLRRSRPVPPTEVPADMITMNSRFALEHDHTGEVICYTLVYPERACAESGRVSALSSMGIALYGARVGDRVCWMSAAGPEVARVRELLYQPEAAGHYHL